MALETIDEQVIRLDKALEKHAYALEGLVSELAMVKAELRDIARENSAITLVLKLVEERATNVKQELHQTISDMKTLKREIGEQLKDISNSHNQTRQVVHYIVGGLILASIIIPFVGWRIFGGN